MESESLGVSPGTVFSKLPGDMDVSGPAPVTLAAAFANPDRLSVWL